MSDLSFVVEPDRGDGTLISFFKRASEELSGAARDTMNTLVRGAADRGWLQPIDGFVEKMVEEGDAEPKIRGAIDELKRWRLLEVADDGKVTTLLGGMSTVRTPHRAALPEDVQIFARGGLELLSFGALLCREVEGYTRCPACDAEITVCLNPEGLTEVSPEGIAGYQTAWDGTSSLEDVYATSPLLCSDACLEKWQEDTNPPEGIPLGADVMLFIGAPMAAEMGDARFNIIARHH